MIISLDTERMVGYGAYIVDDMQVNYLYGLNDLCKEYLSFNDGYVPSILELGTNNGVSTRLLAEYGNVTTVDLLDCVEAKQNSNLSKHGINFYTMSFNTFFENNKGNFYDLIYIDGNHTYESVSNEIKMCLPLLKNNGVLSGHDYNRMTEGVIRAVNEFSSTSNLPIKLFSDSSWAIKI